MAALLVGWLVHAGTLDFAALGLFIEAPHLLIADLAVLAFAVLLGALRWRLLLRLVAVRLALGRALQLHLTGLFFNIVIPGNIGGDVVKSIYVARDVEPARRPGVYLIAFVDRLMGVGSLVVLALIVTLVQGRAAWEAPPRRELALGVVILAAVTFAAPILVLALVRRSGARADRAERESPGAPPAAGLAGRLVAATRLAAARPGMLLAALGLAVALHVAGLGLFAMLTAAVSAHGTSLAAVASVYPVGMLTLVIPISYAGIGVGHVAFERLFEIVGLGGGATVFNVFLIGQTTPCLFGALPYLALRRGAAPPTEAEAAAQHAGA